MLEGIKILVLGVAIENNFQLSGSFQNLKCPFHKTNNGQLSLSYIGSTFWNKTPSLYKEISACC